MYRQPVEYAKLAWIAIRYALFVLALYAIGLHGPIVGVLSVAALVLVFLHHGAMDRDD